MRLRRRSARLVPILFVVGLFSAACGADSSSGSTSRSASSRQSNSTSAQAYPCGIPASTTPREGQDGPGVSLLETAEVAAAQCTDNVRFTFGSLNVDLPPRYVAGYEDGPFIDVNQPVRAEPAGDPFLVIRFEKSEAEFLGRPTYRSRESIVPSGMHHLKEVRQVASPESTVQFVIGLDERRPFSVDGAPSPPHVTVRIA